MAITLLHPWKVRELNAWRELEQAVTTAKAIGKIATLEETQNIITKQSNRK